MKGKVVKSIVLAAVVTTVLMVYLVSTTAASPPTPFNWKTKLPNLQQKLERAGFNVHQAAFEYMDFVKMACTDVIPSALANNPWPNAYMVLTDAHLLEDPNDVRMHDTRGPAYDRNQYWQLREDEAFVLVGETLRRSAISVSRRTPTSCPTTRLHQT